MTWRGMKILHWIWRPDECERLLEAVDSEDRLDYILMTDRTGHNSLQTAILDDNLIVTDIILKYITEEERFKVVKCRDANGSTLLHLCQSGDMVRLILDRLTPDLQQKLILTTNYSRQTAVHRAAIYGQSSVVEAVMEYADEENVKHLLTCQDSIKIHILIWASCGGHKQTIRLVVDLLHDNDLLEKMALTSSQDRETVAHNLNARRYTDEIVYMMKYLSLETRRKLLSFTNNYGYAPYIFSTIPYKHVKERRRKFIPDWFYEIMIPELPIDNQLLKAVNYLMNKYSILSPGAVIQCRLNRQAARSSLQVHSSDALAHGTDEEVNISVSVRKYIALGRTES